MLAKRIIPCLDVDRGRVVKGTNFLNLRDAGDPVEVAKRYEEDGADELVFLDITASHEDRQIITDLVRGVAEEIFMPFCVGGGIRTIEDATALIQAGAEKVSLNTSAVLQPDLITQVSRKFGENACVVNIDPRRAFNQCQQMWYEVFTHGGRKPTGLEAIAWAKEVEQRGAGEIVLTSMDQDGTKAGYNIELTRMVAEAVNIPVVASGGAGHPEHLFQVLTQGKADAALAASIFHYGEFPVPVVKKYLAERGVIVRI
jgi:cyclase